VIELGFSEAAARAIVEQSDYYRDAGDLQLADRWEAAAEEAAQSLTKLPERGAPCRFRGLSLANLRWIFVPGFPKHMLFYRWLPQEQRIVIVHVIHGARNLESILNEEA
jgi:plasmid stabilization system protein ParE